MKLLSLIICLIAYAWFPVGGQLPNGIIDTQDAADQPPSPTESLKLISVPDGFNVSLFAGEPDVAQPIAINYDDRGRLWVLESFSYIEWKRNGRDRILIFEDTDNDGRYDKQKVFWDQGNHTSGFQIGYGGVWICDAPELLFIPDADRDDVPDGKPKVVLDGWTEKAEHNFFNGLTWGPDGWLYGRHGIKQPSLVGKPGTPEEERIPLSCSIWRYHPIKETFEVYADGTINPWGLDWNEEGQPFITTSVVDHLWHLVPGARYARWQDHRLMNHPNPYTYDLMKPTSDHRHWIGAETERRIYDGHDAAGGGHSHSGLMIYQADAWPERYQGRAFTSNILGQRINMDRLEKNHSGYAARHVQDFLLSVSEWFRAVDLKQGPYGEMMVAEWTDLGECHDRDGIHRTSGRLYRVWHGESPPAKTIDVASMTNDGLLDLLWHENVWWRRHALRNIYERAAQGEQFAEKQIDQLMEKAIHSPVRNAVIAVQALHALRPSEFDWRKSVYQKSVGEERASIRAQIVSLSFTEQTPTAHLIQWLEKQISHETSPLVRLIMAGITQRIPIKHRWGVAKRLAQTEIPDSNRNLLLMFWYGLEPLVEEDPERAMEFALSKIHPFLSQSIARRAVSANALEKTLAAVRANPSSPRLPEVLEGILLALPSKSKMPEGWETTYRLLRRHSKASVQKSAFRLAHRFGDPVAEKEMVAQVMDTTLPTRERKELMQLLVSSSSPVLDNHITSLIADPDLGLEAIRALAVFPRKDSGTRLLGLFRSTKESEKRSVILETLVSRTEYADTLVDAITRITINRSEIPAYIARQLAVVSSQGSVFAKHWGVNEADARDKTKLLESWKKRLSTDLLQTANPVAGKKVYQRACATCHQLYGEGEQIGPDLTGSNRTNLDYILINVLFPNEDVNPAFKLVTLTLSDGRTLTGNIINEDPGVITFRQVGQTLRIDAADIVMRQVSEASLMPPGLLDTLQRQDVRDLVRYLQTTEPLSSNQ